MPKPTIPDFPIRGYEFYDYRHDVVNTTFRNFEDNATRKTGAISHLLFTSFGASLQQCHREGEVHQRQAGVLPADGEEVGNDNNAGSMAYKTAVFRDRDGSLGLGPNSFVLINDGVNDRSQSTRMTVRSNPLERRTVQGRCRAHELREWSWPWLRRAELRRRCRRDQPAAVILSREGAEKISVSVGTNVRSGIEFKATTERTSMDLDVTELDAGSWVIVEIPGFTKAASGTEQGSLDALRKASVTSYYKGPDALWVKLVASAATMAALS